MSQSAIVPPTPSPTLTSPSLISYCPTVTSMEDYEPRKTIEKKVSFNESITYIPGKQGLGLALGGTDENVAKHRKASSWSIPFTTQGNSTPSSAAGLKKGSRAAWGLIIVPFKATGRLWKANKVYRPPTPPLGHSPVVPTIDLDREFAIGAEYMKHKRSTSAPDGWSPALEQEDTAYYPPMGDYRFGRDVSPSRSNRSRSTSPHKSPNLHPRRTSPVRSIQRKMSVIDESRVESTLAHIVLQPPSPTKSTHSRSWSLKKFSDWIKS